MPQDFPNTLTQKTQVKLTADHPGLYAISITASCKKRHDLRVEIDEKSFREIPPEKNVQQYDIPPAWNGTKLKGLSQTNIFLLQLDEGEHTLDFIPRKEASVEKWDYFQIKDPTQIKFDLNQQAQNGNTRPWLTFVLVDLPLKSVTAKASVNWHYFDGDDMKLIIDNEVELNSNSILWRYWAWHATPSQLLKGSKTEQKTITKNLPAGIHYLEFWADKTPTLHQVALDLGDLQLDLEPEPVEQVPTKDDPKWTGDFNDDTETMILARLIFGEARNQSQEAMIGVGWTIKNRLKSNKKYFGYSYHEIILKNNGNNWQFSPMNPKEKDNFPLLIDPLQKQNNSNKEAWLTTYEVAESVINEKTIDPTEGATFFHSADLSQKKFTTLSVPGAIYIKRIGDFLFYRDPNEI